MFLDLIRRRNPALLESAIHLHQSGAIPANTYVIDLDGVRENARVLRREAERFGLRIFAMTKQMGRTPGFCAAVREGGIEGAVAVDTACARAVTRAGLRLSHIGHLVQVPRFEAPEVAGMSPQ